MNTIQNQEFSIKTFFRGQHMLKSLFIFHLLEPPSRGDSKKYPQHIQTSINSEKKNSDISSLLRPNQYYDISIVRWSIDIVTQTHICFAFCICSCICKYICICIGCFRNSRIAILRASGLYTFYFICRPLICHLFAFTM